MNYLSAFGFVSFLALLPASALAGPATIDECCYPDDAAVQRALEAFCMAQQPLQGEFRAFWCHSAFGVTGMDWDKAIRRVAEAGFTAILPNMLWGGVAYYESKTLPVAPEVAIQGDQVAKCLAACKKNGVKMHVWKVNWNTGHGVSKEFLDKMRAAGRLQSSSKGKEEPWLCPSHPENQKLEIASMVEVAQKYDVDGIHFDYIRYPDSDRQFDGWIGLQKEWAGKVPVYPGIGVSALRARLTPDRTIGQIEITRRHDTRGFTIFNYGVFESRELLPMLGLGITSEK